jgi:hypothetical protein
LTIQLGLNETLYKKAIAILWDYWDEHYCGKSDCVLSEEHFSKEQNNTKPTQKDIEIAVDSLITMCELLPSMESNEEKEIDFLIKELENQKL